MAKPAYYVFVGVDENGFSEEDKNKLPEMIRRIYDFEIVSLHSEGKIDGVEFKRFDRGKPDTFDPGEFAGFGVAVYQEWFDSGTTQFTPKTVLRQTKDTLEKVERIWEEWGLSVKPEVLCFCSWN